MSFVWVVRVLALVLAVITPWSFASPLSASRLSSSLHRAAGSEHSHVASAHHRAGGHVLVAPRRHIVPFISFADSPNVTVIVPQTFLPVEESVVIEPRSPAPAVFFIRKCGKFIRVPLPEAQTESFSRDHEKCE
jgi:hypothetical protein